MSEVIDNSSSTDQIFNGIEEEMKKKINEVIIEVNSKYKIEYVNSENFDLGYNTESQKQMESDIEKLIAPMSKLYNEMMQAMQAITVQKEAFRIIEIQKESENGMNYESLKIWNGVFIAEGLDKIDDIHDYMFIGNKKALNPETYIRTVQGIRNKCTEMMQDSYTLIKSIKDGINATTQLESIRLNQKFIQGINRIFYGNNTFSCLVAKAITVKAFNLIIKYPLKLITHEDIAADILDKTVELKEHDTRNVNDQTKKETILNNHLLFYRYMGWCNYKMDSAISVLYRERLLARDSGFTDYNIQLLNRKAITLTRRNFDLYSPSRLQNDSQPPGGASEGTTLEAPRGNKEEDESNKERRQAIENELQQMQNSPIGSGPSLQHMDYNFRPGVVPEGHLHSPRGSRTSETQGGLHFVSRMFPTLERIIDLYHFKLLS